MKTEIGLYGNVFKIEGRWSNEGMNSCYNGTVTNTNGYHQQFPIECKIPSSAVRRLGKELFEKDIEKSLVEFLSLRVSGQAQTLVP